MKKCSKCNNDILIEEDISKCPICQSPLCSNFSSNVTNMGISIELDFSFIKCKCGDTFMYGATHCPHCEDKVDYENNTLDPLIVKRKSKLSIITNKISEHKLYIKNLRKNLDTISRHELSYSEGFEVLSNLLNDLNAIQEQNLFADIRLASDTLDSPQITEFLNNISLAIDQLYKLYEQSILIIPPLAWKNAFIRLVNTIYSCLNSYITIISSIVADTYLQAMSLKEQAQQNLDKATDDVQILSNIISIKRIEINYDFIIDGHPNFPVVIQALLMGDTCFDNITDSINSLLLSTYNYFKPFLPLDFQYYTANCDELLYSLVSYRYLSLATFIEQRFTKKIHIVLDTLNKAKQINYCELLRFTTAFAPKYFYALSTISNVLDDTLLNFSFAKNDKSIIRNSLGWYKDLSEGAYKDISSLIVACGDILNNKVVDTENILEWMTFPDKLEYIGQKKKLHFHFLTEGVNKLIRHAVAHVDYDIDESTRVVTIRNKVTKEKIIKEETYSFEEFLSLYIDLQETIFSIIVAFNLFIANNHTDFSIFLNQPDLTNNNFIDHSIEVFLPFLGINDIKIETFSDTYGTSLYVRGVSIDRTDIELFEKCVPCFIQKIISDTSIETISLSLTDINGIEIGTIDIVAKYIRQYTSAKSEMRKYYLLLLSQTYRIEYLYDTDIVFQRHDYGFPFILAILQWLKEYLQDLIDIVLYQKHSRSYTNAYQGVLTELYCALEALTEYVPIVPNPKLALFLKNSLETFLSNILKLKDTPTNSSLASNLILRQSLQKLCLIIADIADTNGDLEKTTLLLNPKFPQTQYISPKVGRNAPCPCGSGKKYKNCCLSK